VLELGDGEEAAGSEAVNIPHLEFREQ
jgi:hypothetical protein